MGLMGILASTVVAGGGEVTGIIPEAIHAKVPPAGGIETIVVPDMHSRKQKMHELSDGFIALPGGIGTFEELLEAFTWSQLGFHAKPVALLNTRKFYSPLFKMLDTAVKEGFMKESHRSSLIVDDTPESLLDAMESFSPIVEDKWIK